MYATYAVLGLVVLGFCLAVSASGPATERSRGRVVARRQKFIDRNPTHVNTADILARLRQDGVSPEQARFITEKASEHGIKAFTMWLWLEQFDAEALGIVVAADLTHRELLTHISNGTVPDLEELKLFAAINGLPTAGPRIAVKDSSAAPGTKAKKRPPMPPIFEPGTWPRAESAVALQDTDETGLPRLGDTRSDEDGLAA